MNKNYCLVQKLLLCAFLSLGSTSVHAQLTPDNTLGTEASKLTPNVLINGASADLINGGALRGSNLFHSFSEFNIKDGQRVYFANPSGVVNILTRVTGSNASSILGTLGVDGAANLFLINPNGILFGQNARLDIGGSFVGTTANGVQFGNQGNFSATNAEAPGLLTINPSALFFNQINPSAGIQNNSVAPAGVDPAGFDAFGLRVFDGKSLLLVGGDVSMDGGQLNALGGRVQLGGVSAPGNVFIFSDGNNLRLGFPENVTPASVSLINQAGVYVEASGGGNIAVHARNIKMDGGSLLSAGIGESLGSPDTSAGDITLTATEEIVINDRSGIRNLVRKDSQGNGGNIGINAGSLKLQDASLFELQDGAQVFTSTSGKGNAGNVTITTKNTISLTGNVNISSAVEAGAVGKGGNIDMGAANVTLLNGAQIAASTRGQGNAGNVTIIAEDTVSLVANPSLIFTTVEAGAVGNGGNIDINAANLILQDGAQLATATRRASETQGAGQGDAGNINVKVTDVVDITGMKNTSSTGIFSLMQTDTKGSGGNITIDAGSLKLQDVVQLSASTDGQGNAGNVTITAKDTVFLVGEADILSTVEKSGVGKGGNITIDAGSLKLQDGARLSASTDGQGNAGNVIITAKDAISLASNVDIFSAVETGAIGKGGNIDINATNITLRDGAQIAASTRGQGNAGNVTVVAKDTVTSANSSLILSTVEAGAVGKGGNIDINAANLILRSGAQLATATRRASETQGAGQGNAGNVNVKVTGLVDIAGLKSTSSTGIFSLIQTDTKGNGGNITIDAGSLKLQDGARLSALTRGQGNAGNVTISAKCNS